MRRAKARQFRCAALRRMGVVHDVMRSRPTSTITTSTSPIQNGQYCGVSADR